MNNVDGNVPTHTPESNYAVVRFVTDSIEVAVAIKDFMHYFFTDLIFKLMTYALVVGTIVLINNYGFDIANDINNFVKECILERQLYAMAGVVSGF